MINTISLRQIAQAVPYLDNLEDGEVNPYEEILKKVATSVGVDVGSPDADLSKGVSLGEIVIACGVRDALWCMHILPSRDQVTLLLPSVKRMIDPAYATVIHNCLKSIEDWLADSSVSISEFSYPIIEYARAFGWRNASEHNAADCLYMLAENIATRDGDDTTAVYIEGVLNSLADALGVTSEEVIDAVRSDILALCPSVGRG